MWPRQPEEIAQQERSERKKEKNSGRPQAIPTALALMSSQMLQEVLPKAGLVYSEKVRPNRAKLRLLPFMIFFCRAGESERSSLKAEDHANQIGDLGSPGEDGA